MPLGQMESCKFSEDYRKNSAFCGRTRIVRPYRTVFSLREKEKNMKKSHKILLILVILVIAAAVIVISNLPIAKTQKAMGELLRKKLAISQDAVITCAGDYTADDHALLWFAIQNQDMTLYQAVDCRVLNSGSYWVKKIYTPSTYARDIVHVVWRHARDIVLINNSDCRTIIYHTSYGDKKTELSVEDIPYVFLRNPSVESSTCDFLDTVGNTIR